MVEPGVTVAGWTLTRRLGSGTQSQVWLAHRGDLACALKLQPLPAGPGLGPAGEAFQRAAALAAGLHHPAIVAVLEFGIDGELGWLAMEPIPGSDLQRYTRPPRLLPDAVVLRLLRRVAEALDHAHRHGIVHRDLKPANVLVNWADDLVKLVDFGIARSAGASQTGTGIVPGTPAYMAPEALAGAEPDARVDLYALGAMGYELLSGRLPHEASTMGELLRRVAQDVPPDLLELRPELDPAAAQLIGGLLARSRQQRPADAAGVARALAALERVAGPDGPPSR